MPHCFATSLASAHQALPAGPASKTKWVSNKSSVESLFPPSETHICGARLPGRAVGTYSMTGLATGSGSLPSGMTAEEV